MFLVVLAISRAVGVAARNGSAITFLFATVGLYAGIGIMSRTIGRGRVLRRGPPGTGVVQRHGDGRGLDVCRVVHRHGGDAVPDRLSTAWLHHGLDRRLLPGRAVPRAYLRKFGQFTVPDFLGERYGGHIPRFIGIVAAILCSFTYVVAQIYGVGLITARMVGVDVRVRDFPGPGRHPGLLVPRRHARGDLDPGRAIHHPDRRLHDSGGVAVGEADQRACSAGWSMATSLRR